MEDNRWVEVEPLGPQEAGSTGGDEQLSESWSRQFVLPANAEGLTPVMTIHYYVALENHNDADSAHLLRRQIEYTLCTDPKNPGDTERWSDYSYVRMPFPGAPTEKDARSACATMPVPTVAIWDGVPWRQTVDSPWWRAGERS
ncbi:hypothetical protein E1091_00180 [Micromonospora fluostatini]|uniref:Uncharacterized protein n=1 Tax=Micromonospora fluostatini TaxID=1629071 RepID=A0ABY2DM88_9ACTN|nr:hypothetical protein E1091_00180 [Micromonospora fluostatini]